MCDCNLCKELRLIDSHMQKIPTEQQIFFRWFIEKHYEEAMDANYHSAILDGSWPNAVEILEDKLAQAKQKRLEMNEQNAIVS